MFDRFADYMYYLLTSPLKKVRQKFNQWYILMKVLGGRFDDAMESLYLALEQTMVATCDPEMLPFHAADRGMARYVDETDENFRVRIANYTEVLRLGGTDAGVLLAVRALGFHEPELIPAKVFTGDAGRWAEFYVVIRMDAGDPLPIGIEVLKKQVRQVKSVGAKDNYCFLFGLKLKESFRAGLHRTVYRACMSYFDYRMLDGSWNLDGSVLLDAQRKAYFVTAVYHTAVTHTERIAMVRCHAEHNLHFLDGSWKLDGSILLDAWQETEEL